MKKTRETIYRYLVMLQAIPREPASIRVRPLRDRLAEDGLSVSLRTIQRDLRQLEELPAFPLISHGEGKTLRWSWEKEAAALELPSMSPRQALAFCLAEDHLSPILPPSTVGLLAPHFERARHVLQSVWGTPTAAWAKKVRLIGRGPALAPPHIKPDIQLTVSQALFEDRQLHVFYRPRGKADPKRYILAPLALVFRDGMGYLVAVPQGDDQIRQFALHRIIKAQVLTSPSRRPFDFDLDEYLYEKSEFGYPVSAKNISFKALFDADAAFHLSERPLSKDQRLREQKDGQVLVEATVRDTEELRWWLLGFGDGVEVVGPTSLRREMAACAAGMNRLYSRSKPSSSANKR
jgi:predicted DNA-binding transcriptional regulator YafY